MEALCHRVGDNWFHIYNGLATWCGAHIGFVPKPKPFPKNDNGDTTYTDNDGFRFTFKKMSKFTD